MIDRWSLSAPGLLGHGAVHRWRAFRPYLGRGRETRRLGRLFGSGCHVVPSNLAENRAKSSQTSSDSETNHPKIIRFGNENPLSTRFSRGKPRNSLESHCDSLAPPKQIEFVRFDNVVGAGSDAARAFDERGADFWRSEQGFVVRFCGCFSICQLVLACISNSQ